MLIFLYGQNTYSAYQKLKEITDHYKKIHKTGLNFKIFDLEEKKILYQDFQNEWKQVSMFSEKKLFVLKNIFFDKDFKDKFSKDSKNFEKKEDIILIYEQGVPKKSSFFSFLKKEAKSQEFKILEKQELNNWIIKEFEKYKTRINSKALDKIVSYVGKDPWQLSNEIKKLASFKSGFKFPEILTEDVEVLVRPKIETDIFKTIDALAVKNKKQALKYLYKHLEKGDSPLYLLTMINFQFRNLVLIKSTQEQNKIGLNLSKELGLHPFVVRKSLWQAQNFTFEELKKIYRKIFEVDYNIKTGRIDHQTAIDLFIAEI